MPDYIVKGVDKDSGFDTELVVNAESPANAKVKAEMQRLVVTMIDGKPVDSSVPSADATPPPLPTSRTETDGSTDKVGVSTKIIVSAFGLVGVVLIAVLVTVLVRGAGPSKPDHAPKQSGPSAPTVQAPADDQAPTKPANRDTATRDRAKPSVTTMAQTNNAMSASELFTVASPAVVRVVVRDKAQKVIGQGSGFFVSEDGLLVTNYHVIEDADSATVLLSSNAMLFVDGVVAYNADTDLALLKVNGDRLSTLSLQTGPVPRVGTKVYAIGNPLGYKNTLSDGIVSGYPDYYKGGFKVIQTTAAISPGSSGGPLLVADGSVIGVTTYGNVRGQNLNFVIPCEQINELLTRKGPLATLASAGGKPLDKEAAQKFTKVWDAMAKGDWSGAVKILTELRKTQQDNSLYWYTWGYLHLKLGNYDIAVSAYKSAIAIKPDYAMSYNNMGYAYSNMGRDAEAITAYKRAIQLDPTGAGQAARKVLPFLRGN